MLEIVATLDNLEELDKFVEQLNSIKGITVCTRSEEAERSYFWKLFIKKRVWIGINVEIKK